MVKDCDGSVSVQCRARWQQRMMHILRGSALVGLSLSGSLFLMSSLQLWCHTAHADPTDHMAAEVQMTEVVMDLGQGAITLQLNDNSATRDLVSRLPLTVELEDFGRGAERIFYLDHELDYSEVKPGSDATMGTVAIYRPWGNVCIFLRSGNPSRDLITLGHISAQDLATLKAAPLGEVKLHQ